MERLAQVAFIVVTLTTIANANPIFEPHLINGTAASPGQFPYSVFFAKKGSSQNTSYCGGAIIGSKYILTSANAIDTFNQYGYQIMVGCVEPYSPYCVEHQSQETIKHPDYDGKFKNNVGIIVLAEDIEFNQFARVIPISTMHVDKNTTMIGMGMDLQDLVVEWAEQTWVNDDVCKARWPEANLSLSFCTEPKYYGGIGTWGHPVTTSGHVVGISYDFGIENNLITRIEPYLLWILNITQGTNIV